jgi:hypothetical protein
MPARYIVDAAQKLVWSEYFGTVTDADVLGQTDRLRADEAVGPGYANVVDCRRIDTISVTPAALRLAGQQRPFDPGSPMAIVAPQAVVYGLARMFQVYLPDGDTQQYRIFASMQDACDWLGIVPPEES